MNITLSSTLRVRLIIEPLSRVCYSTYLNMAIAYLTSGSEAMCISHPHTNLVSRTSTCIIAMNPLFSSSYYLFTK